VGVGILVAGLLVGRRWGSAGVCGGGWIRVVASVGVSMLTVAALLGWSGVITSPQRASFVPDNPQRHEPPTPTKTGRTPAVGVPGRRAGLVGRDVGDDPGGGRCIFVLYCFGDFPDCGHLFCVRVLIAELDVV
jgi:hypothetical protein